VKIPSIVVLVVGLALNPSTVNAAEGATALQAKAVLPPDVGSRVAAIFGCEGRPVPERWRYIVWDESAENGFREYVVFAGKIVSKNTVSQFATMARPEEVLKPDAIQVDSDKAGWIALMYASANNLLISSLHFSLRQTPELSTPVWKVDCFDGTQRQVGSISIAADGGKVLTHLGFANEPSPTVLAAASGVEGAKPKPSSKKQRSKSKPRPRTTLPPEAVAEENYREQPEVRRARRARPDNRSGGQGLSGVFRSIFRD
jgi:hypothetical protein